MNTERSQNRRTHLTKGASNQCLASLLAGLAKGEGFSTSRLPTVSFMRSAMHVPRTPIVYEPGIFIVAQGRKVGYLGERKIIYDANHYLVMSVPLPFECETEGDPQRPLLGLRISVTPAAIAELLLQIEDMRSIDGADAQAMQAAAMDEKLSDTAVRLAESLQADDDARILGPQFVREIIYYVLRGKLGKNLRAVASPDSHFGRIGRVLNQMHTEFARAYDMTKLARENGMSISAFHARFKSVTASSPLQYLKNIRRHKALMLMVHEDISASIAASKVGYESASQFSREFKTRFGDTPSAVAAYMRASLIRL